jgi:peptidoglycan hydrolase-like protein with peptidoglycan-binding domain
MSPHTAPLSAPALRRPASALLGAILLIGLPAAGGVPAWATDVPAPAPSPTATPAPAPAPAADATTTVVAPAPVKLGSRTLRYGDTGADVRSLQKLLKVKRSGYFGKATRKAVKKVQRSAGLKANGVVNAKTLKAIKRAAKARAASRSLPRAGSPAASKRYARAYIASQYGWGDGQMSCLSALWERESGWRYWVSNPNGIYRGIPQTSSRVWGAMGYTTAQYMRSPEIQIKVGAKYIKNRYGSPCSAWSFWQSRHWY